MPRTAAQTTTDATNTALNPVKTVTGRQVVHVTLVFDGVAFNPADLRTALDTQYGTVDSLRDVVGGQNVYEFRISA